MRPPQIVTDCLGDDCHVGDWIINSYSYTRNTSAVRYSRIEEIYAGNGDTRVKLLNYYPNSSDKLWHRGSPSTISYYTVRHAFKCDIGRVPPEILANIEELDKLAADAAAKKAPKADVESI